MIDLTEEQIERYSRHILLQDVGLEGQEKLLNAKVLIIGAGGLGSPVALYLAAAGVGHIGIVDADVVDLSIIIFAWTSGVSWRWDGDLLRRRDILAQVLISMPAGHGMQ